MCLALQTSDPTETAPILGPPPNLGSLSVFLLVHPNSRVTSFGVGRFQDRGALDCNRNYI